nr:MAG TPA: hypothetical protein [Caudoviricetes sp.]
MNCATIQKLENSTFVIALLEFMSYNTTIPSRYNKDTPQRAVKQCFQTTSL